MAGGRDPDDVGGAPPPSPDDEPDLLDGTLGDIDGDTELPDEPDEHEVEDDLPPEDNPEDEPPPRQTRRERREGNWRTEAMRLREEVAELRGRVTAPQQQQPQIDPQRQQQILDAEYDRIAMLEPREQMRALHGLIRQENAVTLQVTAERDDIRSWGTIQREEPAARRLAPEVERLAGELRRQGTHNINREAIYNHLLGQEMRRGSRENGTRERRTGAANVRRQTRRPVNGRSNMAGSPGGRRGSQEAQDIALLQGITSQDF